MTTTGPGAAPGGASAGGAPAAPVEPSFATFWAGPALSPFEAACVGSFARRGYRAIVYSYEPVGGLPEGVEARDAAEVAPRLAMGRFIYAGRPNLSHFSDYFRYLLFMQTPHVWVDADMLLLRRLDFDATTLVARERADSICGAIMRLDGESRAMETLVERTEEAMDRELLWGETGPLLLTRVFGRRALERGSRPPRDFFPVTHDDFYKVFLPEHRDECEAACDGSYGIHLWNNIVDRLGVWKRLAPPEGSYLAARLADDGALGAFDAAYPEAVMRQMVENWRMRMTGEDLGIRTLARQVVPSVGRTFRHYRKRRA